jgi:uncharacterized membrane protein YfcA
VAPIVVLVGFASGILSGMFGVGGAVLTTPGIRAFGATPIEAIGSTIPAILPGSLSGAWHYSREGMVDWRVALTSGLLGSTFAVIGANVSDTVNAHYLMLLTAAMLLWSGLKNLRPVPKAPAGGMSGPAGSPPVDSGLVEAAMVASTMAGAAVEAVVTAADSDAAAADAVAVAAGAAPADERRNPLPAIGVIGAASGFLAGLLGVGGGVLLVPAFTALLKLPPKRAVGSSLVAVAMFSIPAMVRHAQLGHIHWGFALLLVAGVIPGARLGARFTLAGSEQRLRFLMGAFFSVLALSYGVGELLAL